MMSERVEKAKLTSNDLNFALQKRARSLRYLDILRGVDEYDARQAVAKHIALLAAQGRSYKIPPKALGNAELAEKQAHHAAVLAELLYAEQNVPRFVAKTDEYLRKKLMPAGDPPPTIHARRQLYSFYPTGIVKESTDGQGGTAPAYDIWGIPRLDENVTVQQIDGQCVRVGHGGLCVVSAQHNAIFWVDPVEQDGILRQDTQVTISYPE